MVIKQVNFWGEPADAHIIPTNGDVNSSGKAVMGRGLAKQASTKFPGLSKHFGSLLKDHGNKVHFLGEWREVGGRSYSLYSFPTKHHWYEKSDLRLITQSAAELVLQVSGCRKVVIPRAGCGNGRLEWREVEPVYIQFFDNKFTVVHQ